MLKEFPRIITFADSSPLVITYTLAFLLLGVMFAVSRQSFATKTRNYLLNLKSINHTAINMFDDVIIGLVGSVGFIMFMLQNINLFYSPLIVDNNIDYTLVMRYIGIILIAFGIYLIFKTFTNIIISRIFALQPKRLKLFISIYWRAFAFSGILLLINSFVSVFFIEAIDTISIIIGWSILTFFVLKSIVSYFSFFSLQPASIVRFFLYLCTLEILPIMVLVKLMFSFVTK